MLEAVKCEKKSTPEHKAGREIVLEAVKCEMFSTPEHKAGREIVLEAVKCEEKTDARAQGGSCDRARSREAEWVCASV